MGKYLIYSVEDDAEIAHIINLTLKKQGYEVMTFPSGEDFLKAFKLRKPNMVLLDMMLPGIQGKDILHQIRSDKSNENIVIIIVSAKSLVIDKVDGLDEGADDYISKPFDLMEFMSRINAHARRSIKNDIKTIGDISLDFGNKTVKQRGSLVDLTPSEYQITEMLFKHQGQVVLKSDIALMIYGSTDDQVKLKKEFRTIDMHVKDIRQKIGDSNRTFIVTVYNGGFQIN